MERKALHCPRNGEAWLGLQQRQELNAGSPTVSVLAAEDLETGFDTKLMGFLCHELQMQLPKEL